MTAVERDSPAAAARGGELHEGFPSEADAPAAAGGTQPDPSTMAMAAIPRDKRIVSPPTDWRTRVGPIPRNKRIVSTPMDWHPRGVP